MKITAAIPANNTRIHIVVGSSSGAPREMPCIPLCCAIAMVSGLWLTRRTQAIQCR